MSRTIPEAKGLSCYNKKSDLICSTKEKVSTIKYLALNNGLIHKAVILVIIKS